MTSVRSRQSILSCTYRSGPLTNSKSGLGAPRPSATALFGPLVSGSTSPANINQSLVLAISASTASELVDGPAFAVYDDPILSGGWSIVIPPASASAGR